MLRESCNTCATLADVQIRHRSNNLVFLRYLTMMLLSTENRHSSCSLQEGKWPDQSERQTPGDGGACHPPVQGESVWEVVGFMVHMADGGGGQAPRSISVINGTQSSMARVASFNLQPTHCILKRYKVVRYSPWPS